MSKNKFERALNLVKRTVEVIKDDGFGEFTDKFIGFIGRRMPMYAFEKKVIEYYNNAEIEFFNGAQKKVGKVKFKNGKEYALSYNHKIENVEILRNTVKRYKELYGDYVNNIKFFSNGLGVQEWVESTDDKYKNIFIEIWKKENDILKFAEKDITFKNRMSVFLENILKVYEDIKLFPDIYNPNAENIIYSEKGIKIIDADLFYTDNKRSIPEDLQGKIRILEKQAVLESIYFFKELAKKLKEL